MSSDNAKVETLRVKTFMERYGFGKTKTYEMINSGRLETVKIDGTRLIKAASVRALLEQAA
jgi:excisionase family DNA binding protein